MIIVKLAAIGFLCYLIAKGMNVNLSHENTILKEENKMLRVKLQAQKEEYVDKIALMDGVIKNYRKIK